MAYDKVVDSGVLDSGLTSIANKIRSRSGGSNQLAFPAGFVSEIDNIPTGGGMDEGFLALASGYAEGDVVAEFPEVAAALGIAINQSLTGTANADMETLEITQAYELGNPDLMGTGLIFAADPESGRNLTRIVLNDTLKLFIGVSGGTTSPFAYGALEEFSAPNLSKLVTDLDPTYAGLFTNAIHLETVHLESLRTVLMKMFEGCRSLQVIDLHSCEEIGEEAFNGSGLKALVLRNQEGVVNLSNSNALAGTPIAYSNGYIYIPRALYSDYQSATNWSTYSAQFRALEDYTDDGTVDGEFIMPTV